MHRKNAFCSRPSFFMSAVDLGYMPAETVFSERSDPNYYFLKSSTMLSIEGVNCLSFTPAEDSIFFEATVA